MRITVEPILGDWVEQADIERPESLHVSRNRDTGGDAMIVAGPFTYLPHPFQRDLWYAPGVGCFLYLREQTLWLQRGVDGSWTAYCRPGLSQLAQAPMAPCTLVTREALIERFARCDYLLTYEFDEQIIDCAERVLCRLWIGVGDERRMWDRAGLFDLRDFA
jgi:hypothetical protein